MIIKRDLETLKEVHAHYHGYQEIYDSLEDMKDKRSCFFEKIELYYNLLYNQPKIINNSKILIVDLENLNNYTYSTFSEIIDFLEFKLSFKQKIKFFLRVLKNKVFPFVIPINPSDRNWDIYIISTSYCHFSHALAEALKIPVDHVFCTELNIKSANETFNNIKSDVDLLIRGIFQQFVDGGNHLNKIIDDLNEFFWKNEDSDYFKAMNQIQVRGGKRKELAVEAISNQTQVPISEIVALGDSITDINMLQRLKDEDGIAVSFNGNRFTVSRANIAVTTTNNLGTLPIFDYKDNLDAFLESWESLYSGFRNNPKKIPDNLISKEIKNYFIKHQFVPEIEDLKNKTKEELDLIVTKQERMRRRVRGWAGNLG